MSILALMAVSHAYIFGYTPAYYSTPDRNILPTASVLSDMDMDGIDEVVVSSHWASTGPLARPSGIIEIFLGSSAPRRPWTTLSGNPGEEFGAAVRHGDLDCDGIDDMVTYVSGTSPNHIDVFLGPLPRGNWHISDYDRRILLPSNSWAEPMVYPDVTGDGCDDLLLMVHLVGQPARDKPVIVEGTSLTRQRPQRYEDVTWANLSNEPASWLNHTFARWGLPPGDVDGDGLEDLLLQRSQTLQVISGGLLQAGRVDDAAISYSLTGLFGTRNWDDGGRAAPAGDLDGDGLADIVRPGMDASGQPFGQIVTGAEITSIPLGGAEPIDPHAVTWDMWAAWPNSIRQLMSAGVTDIDDDGSQDLVIGVPYLEVSNGHYLEAVGGGFQVYPGIGGAGLPLPGTRITSGGTWVDGYATDWFGTALGMVTGVECDGTPGADLLMGASEEIGVATRGALCW